MDAAQYGVLSATVSGLAAFLGAVIAMQGKSKDTAKEVFVRTITAERAQWRIDLREATGNFVETAYKVVGDRESQSLCTLQKFRVHIKLRLNPNPEHKLDASILASIDEITNLAIAQDEKSLKSALTTFESDVQTLLKNEWDKSKEEAVSGKLVFISRDTTLRSKRT